MRTSLRYSLVLLCFFFGVGACTKSSDFPATRNVLVIVVDALRADHLGAYGYSRNTSPAIDQLAREGALFEIALSPASWTKPAVASLFTGLTPLQHRVFTGNNEDTKGNVTSDILADEHVTLAEHLRAAAYRTGGFVNNAHLRSFMGFDQGFDFYDAHLGDAMALTESFLAWQQQVPCAKFFAYLHLLDVHWPYEPPAGFGRVLDPPRAALDFNNRHTWKQLERELRAGKASLSTGGLEAMQALYDGEIRYVDAVLGQLFSTLRARGLYDETLIVLTADHGEEFLEHGGVSHGHTLYEEMVRVPLVVHGPGVAARRVAETVELTDLLPTVLDWMGIDAPPALPGRSLRDLLLGGIGARATPVFADHRPKGSAGPILQSVRAVGYKLIRKLVSSAREPAELAAVLSSMRNGTWIELEGEPLGDGRFLATEIESIDERNDIRIVAPVQKLSGSAGEFRLLGVRCELSPTARVRDAAGADPNPRALRNGGWVKARGHTWQEGVLQLRKMEMLVATPNRTAEIKAPIQDLPHDSSMAFQVAGLRVVVDDDTKWKGPPVPVKFELYNLSNDPRELDNLAETQPARVTQLNNLLDEWERRHERQERPAESVELDPATVAELKALGYLE